MTLRTLTDVERAAQALIDDIDDAIFVEGCEEIISAATVARDARQEELDDQKED